MCAPFKVSPASLLESFSDMEILCIPNRGESPEKPVDVSSVQHTHIHRGRQKERVITVHTTLPYHGARFNLEQNQPGHFNIFLLLFLLYPFTVPTEKSNITADGTVAALWGKKRGTFALN